MARPLRIDVADGWYHVTGRGIERRALFEDQRDHEHFMELLEKTVEQHRVVVHAHAELVNHYHLVLQTPEANLSRAMQWLNVSYAAWFNRRHERVGPLFQGRFKSIPVENSAWAYELSLYVHLNAVMSTAYGLGKQGKQVESQGLSVPDTGTPETTELGRSGTAGRGNSGRSGRRVLRDARRLGTAAAAMDGATVYGNDVEGDRRTRGGYGLHGRCHGHQAVRRQSPKQSPSSAGDEAD